MDLAAGACRDVIAQLRYCGRVAEGRSWWLLGVLNFVILMGLGSYLFLPFWKQFVDGQRATLNRTITAVELVGRDLSDTRGKLLTI